MKKGFLSYYFEDVAVKRLKTVEVNTEKSNQHEFNGTETLKNLFGDEHLDSYPVSFVWLGNDENDTFSSKGSITWYDARKRHPSRTEWRLYFKSNEVTGLAEENDLLIVARKPDQEILLIIIQYGSTFESQLLWLFGIEKTNNQFYYQSVTGNHNPEIDFAIMHILETIGIEIQVSNTHFLDSIIEPYIEKGFPAAREFSRLAEQSLQDCDPVSEPDTTLIKWMEQEEKLFKRLEKHIVKNRLNKGFTTKNNTDVDSFVQFSLSVHNRRKSRAGHALENHLQSIFNQHNIKHSRGRYTENKSKPDFIFPGIEQYQDNAFPCDKLTMLGAKSTCKDRWRQVLAEADRINRKHLLTLEPGISVTQTNEMITQNLQLVIPSPLHETYKRTQRQQLMNLNDFISTVKERQTTL